MVLVTTQCCIESETVSVSEITVYGMVPDSDVLKSHAEVVPTSEVYCL